MALSSNVLDITHSDDGALMTLSLRKITANIGARVFGVDPADEPSDATVAELRAALVD